MVFTWGLFGKKPGVQSPVPGERWILKCQISNPFTRDTYTVTIKDVKEDWVLYDMGYIFHNETKTVEDFTNIYQKREV